MRLFKLLLLMLLFAAGTVEAQTDFRPGYVVRLTGDTLYGQIDYRESKTMCKGCRFMASDQSVTEYNAQELKEYRFTDGRYFITKELKGAMSFFECLYAGRVTMYYLKDDSGDRYFVEKNGLGMQELIYHSEVDQIDGKNLLLQSTKHIGVLIYYMQDAPELIPEIEKLSEPNHLSLIKLAMAYQQKGEKNEQTTVYKSKIPYVRIMPEISGGIIGYVDDDIPDLRRRVVPQFGLITHLWLPMSSEKLFIRTGLLYTRVNAMNEYINFYKIPIQFEYIYPSGIFRPKMALGCNYYLNYYLTTLALDLGANVKLNKSFFLSVNSAVELQHEYVIVPKGMISVALHLGLVYTIN